MNQTKTGFAGAWRIWKHLIGAIRSFGLPVVVALNRFPSDTEAELAIVKQGCEEAGAFAAVDTRVFTEGGAGRR